jgi:hypothetical protein
VLAAGGFDEDAAHGLGGGREEMPTAVPPIVVGWPDQSEVRFMDQCGWLKGVVRRFAGHPHSRELPQLFIDKREQIGGSLAVASHGGVQKERHIGHDRILLDVQGLVEVKKSAMWR